MDFRDKAAGAFTEADFFQFVDFLFSAKRKGPDGFLHGAVGLSGESGEVLDMIKKHWVYDKSLDVPKLLEEMGDTLHYFFQIIIKLNEIGVYCDLNTIMANNVTKLRKRYPNGFTKEDAIARRDTTGGVEVAGGAGLVGRPVSAEPGA